MVQDKLSIGSRVDGHATRLRFGGPFFRHAISNSVRSFASAFAEGIERYRPCSLRRMLSAPDKRRALRVSRPEQVVILRACSLPLRYMGLASALVFNSANGTSGFEVCLHVEPVSAAAITNCVLMAESGLSEIDVMPCSTNQRAKSG